MSEKDSTHIYVARQGDCASLKQLIDAVGVELALQAMRAASRRDGFAVVVFSADRAVGLWIEDVAQLLNLRRVISVVAREAPVGHSAFGVGPVAFCVLADTELAWIREELADLDDPPLPQSAS